VTAAGGLSAWRKTNLQSVAYASYGNSIGKLFVILPGAGESLKTATVALTVDAE
jgi:hypothetical protein